MEKKDFQNADKTIIIRSLDELARVNDWKEFSDEIIRALYERFGCKSIERWRKIVERVMDKCKFKATFSDFYDAEEWIKEHGWEK